jgi:DNA-binding CsgD family transcriptional regulator
MKAEYNALVAPNGDILFADKPPLVLEETKLEAVVGVKWWEGPWFSRTPGAPESIKNLVDRVCGTGKKQKIDITLNMLPGVVTYDIACAPVMNDVGKLVSMKVEVNALKTPHDLSHREREVLSWTAMGKTAIETGTILGISKRTVEWHLTQVRQKLCAVNITHTIAMAVKAGVIVTFGLLGITGYSAKVGIRMLHTLDMVGGPGGIV